MFGGDTLKRPKCFKRTPPQPPRLDIHFPSIEPGYYQHIGRPLHSDYHVRMLQYKQARDSRAAQLSQTEKDRLVKQAIEIKYDKHFERSVFERHVKDKVLEKLRIYEESIENRREKLKAFLCEEERQFYYEVLDLAQKGAEKKLEDMKTRVETLRANREAERVELVHQKRIEQYRDRCMELRPILIQKNLIEARNAQLQQIRENEARRESEKELDKMWHHLNAKEMQAKIERENQDLIKQKQIKQELLETWEKQVKGKELLKEEVKFIAREDRLEMIKLSEQLRREEIEALDSKRRKRDLRCTELREQLKTQEQFLAQRRKEEEALDKAFAFLTQQELDNESKAIRDTSIQAKREVLLYKKHLEELEVQRKQEEKELEELLEIHRKELEKVHDEAKCKLVEAKRELQRNVMQGRAEQLEYKRQAAEQQLKLKQAENELIRMAFETNERLQAEQNRMDAEVVRQYRDDLIEQIQYNNILREREAATLERQLIEGLKEEEKYRKIVEDMVKGEIEMSGKHPFRKVLERYDCHCPTKK